MPIFVIKLKELPVIARSEMAPARRIKRVGGKQSQLQWDRHILPIVKVRDDRLDYIFMRRV